MSDQITNYQCPACTGPLHFNGASGKLECDYCDSKFDVAEIEALYADAEKKAEEAFEDALEHAEQEAKESEAFSDGTCDWGEDTENMRVYNCPSCGAELICDATTAATSCPYCGNPSVVPGQFSGVLKPDFVIPFMLDKNAAMAALKEHYKGKFFLPKAFKDENHISEMKGIYVPFWLYDTDTQVNAIYHATRSHSHRSGDYQVTETQHYEVRRQGAVRFENIPVDASTKMPDDYMDSIEPFDFGMMKPFSTAYLPGFLADRYDVNVQECAKRAQVRCATSALSAIVADVKGYHTVSTGKHSEKITHKAQKYVLIPVWTLHTKWKDKDYLFMMNGQTGKFVGNLPIDTQKYWLTFAGITAAATALLSITGIGSWLADMFMMMLG